jgi:hypothetical protein
MGSAIRAGQPEGQEEGRSPRAPPAKGAAPPGRGLQGGGGGGGAGAKAAAASPAPSSGGGGGARGTAAAGPAAAAAGIIPPYLKTFRVEDDLLLYAPSPSDALAEAISNKECQVYYGASSSSFALPFAAVGSVAVVVFVVVVVSSSPPSSSWSRFGWSKGHLACSRL